MMEKKPMRSAATKILTVSILCSFLFAGCEWTSSSSGESWSNRYDDMNFSGTYRVGTVVSGGGTSTSPSGGESEYNTISVSETVGNYSFGTRAYSGKLHGGVIPGSVQITAGGYIYTDDGNSLLIGNTSAAGNGNINYGSGAWSFTVNTFSNADFPSSGNIRAAYAYSEEVSGGSDSGGTAADSAVRVKSITVTQTGQYLTFTLSNGLVMEGRFGKVNQFETGDDRYTYNAQFEVSSRNNKMVGTLDSTGGSRVLNATWISGRNTYDVHGIGGAVAPGRTNVVQ
jgi:hypothetical protein